MKNALRLFVGLIAILMMVACQPDYTGALIGGNPNPVTPPGDTFTWDISARLAKHSRGAAEDHDNWKEVESVTYTNGTISIVANVEGLASYASSNEAQGPGKWIGILVGTGESDITKISYKGTPLEQTDVTDRNDMLAVEDNKAAKSDEFVIWYKAEELLKNGASFTLSHEGASDVTVNVVLTDGYNVLNSEEELALLNGGKGKYQLGKDFALSSQLTIAPSAELELNGDNFTISRDNSSWSADDPAENNAIVLVSANDTPVIISDLNVEKTGGAWDDPDEAGDVNWHSGEYGIKVYGSTAVTLKDISVTSCNAGILVGNSDVSIEGDIAVGGNAFGGIEVSVGDADGTSNLTIAEGTKLTCGDETVPAAWRDEVLTKTTSITDNAKALTAYTHADKADQVWYLSSDQRADTFGGKLTVKE